mmetsp:Transcript_49716/g.44549  ORF Transcript_49716/g.44549 Transcript_49716/m.44549 type:complete len:306 (+) Transcript_49716:2-919(+)
MSEDMHTPPLPHNKHNSSSSMNTVRKKDSVFTTSAGRISNLINQNSDLNSGQSPYPTLNEDSPEPEPMTKSEADREDEEKNNDKLKKRDTSSPRRYSKRASEFKNGHNGNNGLLENGLPQPINPMIQHRQSIKKKVTINPTDIFGNKNITSKSSKSNQNGHRQSQLNNHTHYHLMNDQTKKRNSIKHQHKGGAPVTRSASAPRTSQQFNPQSLKKRQSQQFQQALPTIMSANHSSSSHGHHDHPMPHPQRRRTSSQTRNQYHKNHKTHSHSKPTNASTKTNTNTNTTNGNSKSGNAKEDGNCLIM